MRIEREQTKRSQQDLLAKERLSGLNLAAASLTEQVINEVSEEVGRRGSEEQLLEMQQGCHLQGQLVYELSEISAVCEQFFSKLEADVLVRMAKDAAKELTQLREQVAVLTWERDKLADDVSQLTEAQAALETQAVHLPDQLELAKHEHNEFAGKLETSKKEAEKNRIMQDELDGIKLALKVQVLLYFMSPLGFMRF
jgi:hypothetical protein